MNIKIANITILLNDVESGSNTTKMVREDNSWRIDGPVYPRHVKLMDYLNDYIKSTEGGK